LQVVDHDDVSAGNISRQAYHLQHVGHPKAVAAGAVALSHNPYLQAVAVVDLLGGINTASHAGVVRALQDSDLVIDATAAPAVTRYLAHHARAAELPFLHVSATPGTWGGTLVWIDPGASDGCWACLEHHRQSPRWPRPPADRNGTLTAPGCGTPTFTGQPAHLVALAAAATSLAQTKFADPTQQHGSQTHVATLSRSSGPWVAPRWRTRGIPIHPNCPLHDTRGQLTLHRAR
jgi:hypothetical protein